MADTPTEALRTSAARLHDLASILDEDDLTAPAYPSQWSIADVLSHLGSGAVILKRQLDDTLAARATPDDFAASVWDTWNAKTPATQRDDALAADAALLARIDAVTADQRAEFQFRMGPMTFGFDQFLGLRLNEHALHTWDIDVAHNTAATIPDNVAALVVDNLELIARYTGKPTGETTTITVVTHAPDRRFNVQLGPDAVSLTPVTETASADLQLSGEAFARLVYGRLDAEHTPPGMDRPGLDNLRHVFPGP